MINEYLAEDHRRCDDLFADAVAAASRGGLDKARETFERFHAAIERHLAIEEEILFPAFEKHTEASDGPTHAMRMEHAQMRELFGQMHMALASGAIDAFLGVSETLMVLMLQHNLKEENRLFPMAERALQDGSDEVVAAMQAVAEEAAA
jgi:hemerythrin-like domain-containing protein